MQAIDIDTEDLIGLFEVPKHFPSPRKPSRPTVFRWARQGILIDGTTTRVVLQTVKLGGIKYTSLEAITRFIRAINGHSDASVTTAG